MYKDVELTRWAEKQKLIGPDTLMDHIVALQHAVGALLSAAHHEDRQEIQRNLGSIYRNMMIAASQQYVDIRACIDADMQASGINAEGFPTSEFSFPYKVKPLSDEFAKHIQEALTIGTSMIEVKHVPADQVRKCSMTTSED